MGLRVVSIASGSSGNSILVEAGDVRVLVDAGMTAKRLSSELRALRVEPSEIGAVFLTHEHGDHVGAVAAFSRRYKVPVVANEETLEKAKLGRVERAVLRTGSSLDVGSLSVTSFALSHDGVEPVGYLLEHDRHRICIATDLGYAPESIKEYLHGADLVVLEANHDVKRLVNGPYSSSLKSRILGYTGHLSNQQAAECIVNCTSGRPQWYWLAHLSDINNSPRVALKSVRRHLQQAGIDNISVEVALRDTRSVIWDAADAWVQPRLL